MVTLGTRPAVCSKLSTEDCVRILTSWCQAKIVVGYFLLVLFLVEPKKTVFVGGRLKPNDP